MNAGARRELGMRFFALITVGFALFFTVTSIYVWGDFIQLHSRVRFMAFGVAWVLAFMFWGLTIELLFGAKDRR